MNGIPPRALHQSWDPTSLSARGHLPGGQIILNFKKVFNSIIELFQRLTEEDIFIVDQTYLSQPQFFEGESTYQQEYVLWSNKSLANRMQNKIDWLKDE